MSDLVGNPEDRFSHNKAHIMPGTLQIADVQTDLQLVLCCLYRLKAGLIIIDFWYAEPCHFQNQLSFEDLINHISNQVSSHDVCMITV